MVVPTAMHALEMNMKEKRAMQPNMTYGALNAGFERLLSQTYLEPPEKQLTTSCELYNWSSTPE